MANGTAIQFILVLPFGEVKSQKVLNPKTKKNRTIRSFYEFPENFDLIKPFEDNKNSRQQTNTIMVSIPKPYSNTLTERSFRFCNANGFVDTYNLKRYRSSKDTFRAKTLRKVIESYQSVLLRGTAKDQQELDQLKVQLSLLGFSGFKLIAESVAQKPKINEL